MAMHALGIDIGGTGLKAAVVDTATGLLASPRKRVATPVPCTPVALLRHLHQLVAELDWHGPVGVGFPGVVRNGVLLTAVNLHPKLVGYDLAAALGGHFGRPVAVLNDADAAGWGEMRFGAGRQQPGTVMMITVGTGIGTALFVQGRLVPNTELGHLEMRGRDAEKLISEPARKRRGLSWAKWGGRFSRYLGALENLLWPELFILGGGGAKQTAKFLPHLHARTPIVPAQLGNLAGIVGAAWASVASPAETGLPGPAPLPTPKSPPPAPTRRTRRAPKA